MAGTCSQPSHAPAPQLCPRWSDGAAPLPAGAGMSLPACCGTAGEDTGTRSFRHRRRDAGAGTAGKLGLTMAEDAAKQSPYSCSTVADATYCRSKTAMFKFLSAHLNCACISDTTACSSPREPSSLLLSARHACTWCVTSKTSTQRYEGDEGDGQMSTSSCRAESHHMTHGPSGS